MTLLSILLFSANDSGRVDAFPFAFAPRGLGAVVTPNTRLGAQEHPGVFHNKNRGRFQDGGGSGFGTQQRRRGSRATHFARNTQTQLGISLVLPLPLSSTRLSGTILKIAESWAPSVGVLTSTLLYLAPARAVWSATRRARNQFSLEDDPMHGLNPLPLAIMPSVAISWLAYGLASSDPYLILGNLPGTLISVAYLIAILPLMNYNAVEFPSLPNIVTDIGINNKSSKSDDKNNNNKDENPKIRTKPKKSKTLILTQATVLLSTAGTLGIWAILGLMTAGATDGMFNVGGLEFGMGFSSMLRSGVIVETLGVYAASLFIVLSGSPLSTIKTVLKTKNSRTILGPLTAAQCVNTGIWTAYGFAVNDHFVWGPNIIVSKVEHGDAVCELGWCVVRFGNSSAMPLPPRACACS